MHCASLTNFKALSMHRHCREWGFEKCLPLNLKLKYGQWPGVLWNCLISTVLPGNRVVLMTSLFPCATVTHIWKHLKARWESYNSRASKRSQRLSLLWRFLRFNWCWLCCVKPERWSKISLHPWFDRNWGIFDVAVCSIRLLSSGDFNTGINKDDMTGKSDSRALFVCWDLMNVWNNCA